MDIDYQETYEAMSQRGADFIRRFVQSNPDALICFATGSSPKRMYEILGSDPIINESNVRAIMLDEWHGLDIQHPSTCRFFAEQHIFTQWNIPEKNRFIFNAAAKNPEKECRRIALCLEREGPVDLCVLGLGRNGHVGLNEPADILYPHAHVVQLDSISQKHSMLADEDITVSRGMTLGMADLNCSRQVLMLISGNDKKEVANAFLEATVSTQFPAGLLHLHPQVFCIIDKSVLY